MGTGEIVKRKPVKMKGSGNGMRKREGAFAFHGYRFGMILMTNRVLLRAVQQQVGNSRYSPGPSSLH